MQCFLDNILSCFFSCPYFRNEVGGEEERIVALTRATSHRLRGSKRKRLATPLHRPRSTYEVSLLELPQGDTYWKRGTCPYSRSLTNIESTDHGANYYKTFFYLQGKLVSCRPPGEKMRTCLCIQRFQPKTSCEKFRFMSHVRLSFLI